MCCALISKEYRTVLFKKKCHEVFIRDNVALENGLVFDNYRDAGRLFYDLVHVTGTTKDSTAFGVPTGEKGIDGTFRVHCSDRIEAVAGFGSSAACC